MIISKKGTIHYGNLPSRINLRGAKVFTKPLQQYSIPKPKGGKELDLLLREDQLLEGKWKQHINQKKKKTNNIIEGLFNKSNATV